MRGVSSLLVLLSVVAGAPAAAEPRAGTEPGPGRALLERGALTSHRDSEEAAARQAAFDRRIAERSQRAARSICSGCGTGGRSDGITPDRRAAARDAWVPADPAQAPLD